MSDESAQSRFPIGTIALGLFVIVLVPFMPLIGAGLEHLCFGTNRVEDFCRHVGIHELLGKIYAPILRLF